MAQYVATALLNMLKKRGLTKLDIASKMHRHTHFIPTSLS